MKPYILSLFLIVCFYATAIAQKADQKNPCATPLLELYDAQNRKLMEGELPRGKVTIVLKNNPACNRKIDFKLVKAKLYLVSGARPYAQAEIESDTFDFTDWEEGYQYGNRIFFEITDITYTFEDGKTGKFPGFVGENWHYKKPISN